MRLFFIGMLCLALAACGGAPGKTYSYTPPTTTGGRMCTSQCQMSDDYCRQGCDMKYRSCVGGVQSQALKDYDKYTREQYANGDPIDLTLRDFERMNPCNDAEAACYSSCVGKYGLCYGNCGGKVEVTQSCGFLCF